MGKYFSESEYIRFNNKLYWVNAKEGMPIFTKPMKKIISQVEAIISWHSRTFITVFSLHLPVGSRDNQVISMFIAKVRYLLKRDYAISRFGYTWCREQDKSTSQHYHVGLLLDGSKINVPYKLLKRCAAIWSDITDGGYLNIPQNCYYHFHRSDKSGKGAAIYRLSYQAKCRSKDPKKRAQYTNDYGTSRITPRPIKVV